MLHYKGLSHSEASSIQIDEALAMYEYAETLEARKTLLKLNIADYPNMSKDNRSKLFKEIRKQAYPNMMKQGISFSEFARMQNNG